MKLDKRVYSKLIKKNVSTINNFMALTGIKDEVTLTEMLVLGYGQYLLRSGEPETQWPFVKE